MPCINHTGEYLSYKCYSKLEYLFDISRLYDDGQKIFDDTLGNFKGSHFINAKNKVISDLARFLTADGAFTKYGYKQSCMYINFWLNKQVKKSYSNDYSLIFKHFNDFASKFAEERLKKYSFGYSCENHINELVGNEYRIKQILYNFYDHYNKHKAYLNNRNRDQLCNYINMIVSESHNANDYINQDENFAKQLKELKNIIQNEKHHKNECNYTILKNMLPKEDPIPKAETSSPPVDKSTLQDPLPKPPNDNLEHRVDENSPNVEMGLSETERLGQQSKLQEVEPRAEMTELENPQELPFTVLQEEDPLLRTWPPAGRFLEQDRESPRTQVHLLDDTEHTRSATGGALGSIQNTLTEFLGSVQPAPVLGVSGGMGALFLLFKYTPVGTFFRGRRGRTYGIPSGFNGPFQGGLAGYEDYYGGNLGSDRFHVSYQA
ncbi:PIR protein [Plasmodium vivax]|nr:PIR protein [Plasmodium vivax]